MSSTGQGGPPGTITVFCQPAPHVSHVTLRSGAPALAAVLFFFTAHHARVPVGYVALIPLQKKTDREGSLSPAL